MATIKTIDDYKADYNAARAKGDAAGMQAANDGANAIRRGQGVAEEKATSDIAKIAAQSTPTAQTHTATSSGVSSNFQGSATGVNVNTSSQQSTKDLMNKYSQEWHTADPDRKKWLEAENQRLAAELGGSVGFNPGSGTWDGTAAGQQAATATTGVNDYSSYLEDMYKAQQAAALAALRSAYEKNVAGLDRTQSAIAPQYQSARNEAAAQSELQKRNFAEYAAANGLNSGAGGQAQLAFTNALQGNLSDISSKEASTLADLELQRSQMESDYENAIAQAEAQGNYELAQQLYQEKVRQDEAMRQQMQWQAQMDLQTQQFQFNKDQTAIGNDQWNQQQDTSNQQWNQQWALTMAQELAQKSGDYSLYKALGYSDEQIQNMKNYWDYMQQQSANKSTNTGSGGSNNQSQYYDPNQLFQDAYGSGQGAAYIMMNAKNYGISTSQVEGMIANYQDWESAKNAPSNTGSTGVQGLNLDSLKRTVSAYLKSGDVPKATAAATKVWDLLTQAQKNEMSAYFSSLGYTLGEG